MADLLPEHPDFLWRNPEPKSSYDAVIVGGGGHGLATAYFLAKNHGMTNIAILERGWLAGGNMARNTTIIRSNYLWDESAAIYEHSLKLWEQLPEELEYDFLFSQRGVLNLAHTLGDVRESVRRVEANKLNGVDAEWLTPEQVKEVCPIVNIGDNIRYPVMGATYQPRAGIAKHDHVAWAFARKCDEMGVDIIQNCEVTGFLKDGDRVTGVETTRGRILTDKVGLAAAGHSSLTCSGVIHSASTPLSWLAPTRRMDSRTSPRVWARFMTPRWEKRKSYSSSSGSCSQSFSECS